MIPLTYTIDTPIGSLVAERPGRALVFDTHGIDYCCGKLSLAKACLKKGLDPQQVLEELQAADALPQDEAAINYGAMSITELSTLILDTHHVYLRETMGTIQTLADKVARVHGENHPELRELARVYTKFHHEMLDHLNKEEQILFPALVHLESGAGAGFPVTGPISVMERDHDESCTDLDRIRELTANFALPQDACNSYRALFKGLQDIEQDTLQHIHKENNILFVKGVACLC